MTDRFFLCCGLPKSGTTFLQRILGMHPEVSCPSEQNFDAIVHHIKALSSGYNKALKIIDQRTGGQGAPSIDNTIAEKILRDTILNLSRGFADKKPVHGLNDNSVFSNLKFYNDLFGAPPVICLFRNPVDRAVSNWSHNHRLAEEEKDRAADHLKLLENPEGTLEGYIKMHVSRFGKVVDQFLDYAQDRSNILTVRYESLEEDKMAELRRLFTFLGVDSSPTVMQIIREHSSRENMAADSTQPAFFGLKESGNRRPALDAEFRAQALIDCSPHLERLGYPSI